jgi:hypothetical protein
VIYFLQSGDDGPIRIGWTLYFTSRLRAHREASPTPLRVLGTMKGGFKKMRAIYDQFQEHWIDKEWFNPASNLLTFIAENTTPYEEPEAPRLGTR